MPQPTTRQLERLLRSGARQLTTIADAIGEGADLKDVCDSAYIVLSRTTQVVAAFDIPELLESDPRKEEAATTSLVQGDRTRA